MCIDDALFGTSNSGYDEIPESEKCIWYHMSLDLGSTTFEDVKYNPNHHLYKCWQCDGYPECCPYYQPLESFPDDKNT